MKIVVKLAVAKCEASLVGQFLAKPPFFLSAMEFLWFCADLLCK